MRRYIDARRKTVQETCCRIPAFALSVDTLRYRGQRRVEVAEHVYFTDQDEIDEHGKPADLFGNPREARTKALLDQILASRYSSIP